MQITKIQITANQKPSTYLTYSPDNTEIFTAGQDSIIKVFCAYTGQELEVYGPHTTGSAISQISISPDQRYIAVALRDDKIVIHDRQQYQQYKKLDENQRKQYQYQYSIDLSQEDPENNIISCLYSKTILFNKEQTCLYITAYSMEKNITQLRKYSFPELKIIKSINLEDDSRETTLSYDDKIIYVASKHGFSYYNTETLDLIDSEELGTEVNDLTWFRKQFLVVPCYQLQKVLIFDTKNAMKGGVEEVYDINCYNYLNTAAVFDNPEYNLIIVGGGIDSKLVAQTKEGNKTSTEIFDMITKQVLFSRVYHGSPLTKVRISSDCQSFSSVAVDGTLFILRLNIPEYKPRPEWQ